MLDLNAKMDGKQAMTSDSETAQPTRCQHIQPGPEVFHQKERDYCALLTAT